MQARPLKFTSTRLPTETSGISSGVGADPPLSPCSCTHTPQLQYKINYRVPAERAGLGNDWKNGNNSGGKVTLVVGLVL